MSKILSIALLSCFALCLTAIAQQKKPNIIMIVVDDLGYNDVSYYGNTDVKTPNLESLSKLGIRMDNLYSNAPVCSPTRASLLSGRYPEMVGVPGLVRSIPSMNFGYLLPSVILLPAQLKKVGYNTAIIGKWNLGLESPNLPNEKGFDYFHGFLDDMMNDYYTHLRNGKNFMRLNNQVINPKGHATDVFTNWATDYIEKQKASKSPFFLYLAYNAPHAPIQPPADFLGIVKDRESGISEQRANLVALIEHLDHAIGQVVSTLKSNQLFENTMIVFVSDNGGQLKDGANNDPYRDGKGTVYEGGIRVPAFVVWPGKIAAGSISKERVMTMDFFPTICAISQSAISHHIDGLNLEPLLTGAVEELPRRDLYFTRREGNMSFSGQTIQAVISDGWKLLQTSPYQPYELYHIDEDAYEKNNLIDKEVAQQERLQNLIIRQIQRGGSIPWQKAESLTIKD